MKRGEYKWVHVDRIGTSICSIPYRLLSWDSGHLWCEERDKHDILIHEKQRRDHVRYYLCPVCYTDEDVEIATIHLIGDIGK